MPFGPGVKLLLRGSPRLLVAPGVVLALDWLRRQSLNAYVPVWVLVLICLFSWPLQLWLIVHRRDFVKRTEARKRGARLPPVIKHTTLGNYEAGKSFREKRANGYLGASISRPSIPAFYPIMI